MANFSIKVLNRGDRYGLNNCLTHDKDEQLVEFYDGTQFVSRYYTKTILEHGARALSLQGDVSEWTVSGAQMATFIEQLKEKKAMNDKQKFEAVKTAMQKQLESKGLYVENDSNTNGLSVSMTQFGLSTVYATITADEIQYHLENMDDEELAEFIGEK